MAATSDAPTKDVETKWKWYGMDIIMSENGTQLIAGTTGGVGTITAALAATLPIPGANVLAAGLTIAFAAKIGEIEVVDYKHRGVHWVITWLQWAAILVTIPLGPGAVTASVAVFIHPSPN